MHLDFRLSIAVVLALVGCDRSDSKAEPAGSATSAASASASASAANAVAKVAAGLPIAPEKIEAVVNPKHEKAYSGPTGTVTGSVVITGDEAPEKPDWEEQIPKDCLAAREIYAKAFREGMMRSAADVFVAVTGYEGYVPAKRDSVTVPAKGCAFGTKTLGVTFGQSLGVVSKDSRSYVPELLGARTEAQLVATPGGKPIQLYPPETGRYVLVDSMRIFATAEVFVVAYATFDVTGLDGKFEIKDVPVGKAKLNALLPSVGLTAGREINVEAGKATNVELELAFDRKVYDKEEEQRFKPKPGASAARAKSSSR